MHVLSCITGVHNSPSDPCGLLVFYTDAASLHECHEHQAGTSSQDLCQDQRPQGDLTARGSRFTSALTPRAAASFAGSCWGREEWDDPLWSCIQEE